MNTANKILKEIGLKAEDAARLILECNETLGALSRGQTRRELISLLRRAVQLGAQAVQEAEQTVSLEAAAWASVEARSGLRPATRRDLRHFVRRILRVEGAAKQPLRRMRTADCKRILGAAFGTSRSSYVKGRAVLHSIFSYGMRQEWCDANPVSRIELPRVEEKPIQPLTPAEVKRLQAATDRPEFREMRFSLQLLLYSGVRPAEVERIRPEDICHREKQLIIRPRTSKTGGGRMVPLRHTEQLQAGEFTIPRDWQRKWRALRRAAGFRDWVPDVCRHTFATYHAAYFRNLPALQLEMGHRDVNLLRTRYTMPALSSIAGRYWSERRSPDMVHACSKRRAQQELTE